MMSRFDRMGDYQKNQLLEFFAYEMSMEQRQKLMKQLPEAYNVLVNQNLMRVVKNNDKRLFLIFSTRAESGLHPVVWGPGNKYEVMGPGFTPGPLGELNDDQIEEAKSQISSQYNPGTYTFHVVPV